MRDRESDPLAAFRRVNVGGTERLLRHACESGVKRFIYISSVKVHGDATLGAPFRATDVLSPTDPYGYSKLEAEELVERIGAQEGIETVIIRPPLVYGPGVAGNFLRLLRLVDKGIPLPFGLVENVRSLVGVDNLCDLIRECITNHSAVGKRFLVSDNSDVSTRQLVGHIATAMSKRARILPVPPRMVSLAAKLVGKSAEASRLLDSLQVDISDTIQTLNWKPPVSLEDGVRSTVRWHQEKTRRDQ
jgi:nucleoside-diphosphate-sugar epimerase